MPSARELRILVATDGSPAARAAVATTRDLPWATPPRVAVVVAPFTTPASTRRGEVRGAVSRAFERVAVAARRALRVRWADAEAAVVSGVAEDAILGRARAFRAGLIVVGWRGHGTFRRLLGGSVSRSVIRGATCPVLVVRRRARRLRRVVIGIDGSVNARRATAFLAEAVTPSAGATVTLVQVVEPMNVPSLGLMPAGVRAVLRRGAATLERERRARAGRQLQRLATRLRRAGWRVGVRVTPGAPLSELLSTVKAERADLLVVGARGAGGLKRLLLGSVAEGAVNRCPVPVLVVR